MSKFVELEACLKIADAAAELHPYSKDPQNPETYSQYNEGWTDACDCIRGRLQQGENSPDADGGSSLSPENVRRLEALLTAQGIGADAGISHLEDLIHTEQDGRLKVLPCKVGDAVYKLCPISPFLEIGDLWDGRRITGDCDRCPWGACDCHDIGPHFDGKYKNIVHEMTVGSLSALVRIIPYFGSIYFLTHEDAEAALKELEAGNE